MLRYSEDHEWIQLDGDIGTVGISPHAIEQLGDIVFVELPEAGATVSREMPWPFLSQLRQHQTFIARPQVKLQQSNEAMLDDLTSITPDRATESWLFKVKVSDTSELDEMMDEAAYSRNDR